MAAPAIGASLTRRGYVLVGFESVRSKSMQNVQANGFAPLYSRAVLVKETP